MKTLFPPLILALCLPLISPAGPYEDATAGNPMYENKKIWPHLTGKEYFLTQQYEKGRVMTWAKPGEGVGGRGGLDAWDPANWLLDGEPATEVRFDENTDLVLPGSDTPYRLDFKRVEGWEPVYRHLTIGKNAELLHESIRYFGNVWVKKGGRNNGRHGNNYMGGHTFFREDNGTFDDPSSGRIGQYFALRKNTPQDSLEVIGNASVLDRMPLEKGMLILSANSRFSPGRNANMVLSEDATLVLLNGSWFTKHVNQIGQLDAVILGKIQGGLPERPLTEPATIGLSYQNTTGVKFFDRFDPPSQGGRSLERRTTSIVFGKGSSIKSISATPEGKINFRWNGLDAAEWHLKGDAGYRNWLNSLTDADREYIVSQLNTVPKQLTAIFQPGVDVDGVVFNDFHAGGLLMENPEDVKTWKNVSFGENNGASGWDMVTRIGNANFRDNVKNPGGDYSIGEPVSFFEEEVPTSEDWTTHSMKIQVPASAAGMPIGITMNQSSGTGWMRVDDVRLMVGGKDIITNGSFSVPELKDDKDTQDLADVPGWYALDGSPTVKVSLVDDNPAISTIGIHQGRFGQTTEYIAKGGETIELSFRLKDGNVGNTNLKAQIYSLETRAVIPE